MSQDPDHRPTGPPEGPPSDETREMSRVREIYIGPYQVDLKIGDGGMGIVYKAFDPKLQRFVALKVLREKLAINERYLLRLNREARVLASLSHPSLIQVFSFEDGKGETRTLPYLVMEYVEGESVEAKLEREGHLETDEAVRFIREAAEGLQAALDRGIVHRDIKPSNLLITRSGAIKIVDFGLAKEVNGNGSITEEGMVLGTPHYISPEQGRGEKVDHRSDIYSLGATFYHMVTGRPAFEGDSQASILYAHIHTPPVPPHRVRAEVSRATSLVAGRMLAKDPADRYPTYKALVDDLRRLEGGDVPGTETRRTARRTYSQIRTLLGARLLVWFLVGLTAWSALVFSLAQAFSFWRPSLSEDATVELGAPYHRSVPEEKDFLDLNFRTMAAEENPARWIPRLFVHAADSRVHPGPRIYGGGLFWKDFAYPLGFRYPIDALEELKVIGLELEGRCDFGIALLDPGGDRVRKLVFAFQADQGTQRPVIAERQGRAVFPEPAPAPLPALAGGRWDVTLRMRTESDKTWIALEVSRNQQGSKPLYPGENSPMEFALEGTDWKEGVLTLYSPSPTRPSTVSIQGIRFLGKLARGKAVEEVSWHVEL